MRVDWLAWVVSWWLPALALANVYSYVDKDGVIHFTNLSSHPDAQLVPMGGSKNTFQWRDKAGVRRQLHRVDVDRYDGLIIEAASYYTLPPQLIKAVIASESAFEPAAVSSAGAKGLMQLMPRTAAAMKVLDIFEPRQNIYGGARYLRLMANRFDGDLRLTVAAYNAGPKAVEEAGGVPRFYQTRTYVRRVLRLYGHYLRTWVVGE